MHFSGVSQFAGFHQAFVRVLAFADQALQFFGVRGEDGTFRQMGECMPVICQNVERIGIYYRRSLAVFQLFYQGSFRFFTATESGTDADSLIIIGIGRYGKACFACICFYHCFGRGSLQDIIVA